MSNTLTGLIPTIYEALDNVSRELVGAIKACSVNAIGTGTERVAKDQTITFPIVPSVSSSTAITPGLYAPDSGDQVIGYDTTSISKAQMVPVRWTGGEQVGLKSGGQYGNIARQRFEQAFRVLCNEIEADLLTVAYKNSSRAYGIAGTAPFQTSMAATAQVRKILDDNGCPSSDRALVINTTAGANLRSLAGLTNVGAAGTDATLRQGVLLDINGFAIRESGQVQTHTKGTMTGGDCTAIEPVGETTIAIDGTNSGTILNGDIITNATLADGLYYIISDDTQTASAAASGNMIITAPGLLTATSVSDEWVIQNSCVRNVAFHRYALHLLTRLPETPEEGDMADDRTIVTDPVSGLSFEIAMYKQYKQVHYEVGICWGYKLSKPEWSAVLMGE